MDFKLEVCFSYRFMQTTLAEHIFELHKKVREILKAANKLKKAYVVWHSRFKTFNGLILVKNDTLWALTTSSRKRRLIIFPYNLEIKDNAYKIDLPDN